MQKHRSCFYLFRCDIQASGDDGMLLKEPTMMIVFAVFHVLEPWEVFIPSIVEHGILHRRSVAFDMAVLAVCAGIVDAESVEGRRTDLDSLTALLADLLLAGGLDVSNGGEIAHAGTLIRVFVSMAVKMAMEVLRSTTGRNISPSHAWSISAKRR